MSLSSPWKSSMYDNDKPLRKDECVLWLVKVHERAKIQRILVRDRIDCTTLTLVIELCAEMTHCRSSASADDSI